VFGVPLAAATRHTGVIHKLDNDFTVRIPYVVSACITHLNNEGLYWFGQTHGWACGLFARCLGVMDALAQVCAMTASSAKPAARAASPTCRYAAAPIKMHFFLPALLTLFFNHPYGQLRHQALFDSRPAKVDLAEFSVHDVAAVLKRYIRELPQPIFTARLQSMFFSALGKGWE